jgi:lysyl-tRNA synthetase class 2
VNGSRRLAALFERWRAAAVLRALLMLVAIADAGTALYVWYLHHHGTRAAIHTAFTALAPVRLLAGVALVGAALYLATRPKRAFQLVLVLVAVGGGLLALSSSHLALIAIAVVDCLAALLAGSLWRELGDPLASRFGWVLLAVAAAAAGFLFVVQHPSHRLASAFALVLVVAFAAAVSALALLDRNPPLPARWDPLAALAVYTAHARSGVAPFALMRDKRHMWGSDGSSFVAFGCRAGVAVALGPAIGPAAAAARLHEEFRAACRSRGWRPAFYQVPDERTEGLAGMVRAPLGSEAVVDVGSFDLDGRRVAKLRHMVARGRRAGMTVLVLPAAALTPEQRAAMRRLAGRVASGRRLGEMGFSVGREGDPALVERTVGLAHDPSGALVAYASWLWLPAAATQVLDEARRDPAAPPGAMELLIASCLTRFRGRADHASLGMAPLALVALPDAVRTRLPAAGLESFKGKFAPAWERRCVLVDRLLDLPAVLVALALLHYPKIARRSLPRGIRPVDTAGR